MRLRRPYWIAGEAFGLDFLAAPSLDRVIQATDQLPCWGKARDQQTQQDVTRGQERPLRTIQDPVIVDETLLLTQPHDPQARSHRAFASGENGSDHQDFGVLPHWLREQRCKLYNQGQQHGRHCQHMETSRGKSGLQLTLSAVAFSKIKNGQSRA
jgi:hypothetical protein